MKRLLPAAILLVLTLVLAPTGVGDRVNVSVTTDEERSECWGESNSSEYHDPGGNYDSYFSESSLECTEHRDGAVVAVSDDVGPLLVAGSTADANDGVTSRYAQSRSSGSDGFSWWRDESWSVAASSHHQEVNRLGVVTTAGDAALVNRCSSHYSNVSYGSTSSYGRDSGDAHDSHGWSASSYESRVGGECFVGAEANHAARSFGAGWVGGCEESDRGATLQRQSDHWYAGGDDHYSDSTSSATMAQDCRNGVEVRAQDSTVFAGQASQCATTEDRSDSTSSSRFGNTTTEQSYWYSYSEHDCRDGLRADGPTGIEVTAGTRSSGQEACSGPPESCYGWREEGTGAAVSWDGAPLGPVTVDAYRVPTPSNPV